MMGIPETELDQVSVSGFRLFLRQHQFFWGEFTEEKRMRNFGIRLADSQDMTSTTDHLGETQNPFSKRNRND